MDGANVKAWDPYDPANKDIISEAASENRLWSLLEENGIMWFELGLHMVNYFGIIICKVPCNENVDEVPFWSEDDEKEILMTKLNGLRNAFTYKELHKLSLEELQELEEKHLL